MLSSALGGKGSPADKKRKNGPKSVLACNRCRQLKIKCTNPALKDIQESDLNGPPPIPDIPCVACEAVGAPCSYELTAYQSKRRVSDGGPSDPDSEIFSKHAASRTIVEGDGGYGGRRHGQTQHSGAGAGEEHNAGLTAAAIANEISPLDVDRIGVEAVSSPQLPAAPQVLVTLPVDSHPDAMDVFFHRLNSFFGMVDESEFYSVVVPAIRARAIVEAGLQSHSIDTDRSSSAAGGAGAGGAGGGGSGGGGSGDAGSMPSVRMFADAGLFLYSAVLCTGLALCGEADAAVAWGNVCNTCCTLCMQPDGSSLLLGDPSGVTAARYHALQASLVFAFYKGSLLCDTAIVPELVRFAWDQRSQLTHVAPHVDAALTTDACVYLHVKILSSDPNIPRLVASRITEVSTHLMDEDVSWASSRGILRLARDTLTLAESHRYVHVRALRAAVRQLQAEMEIQRHGMNGRALSLTSSFLRILKFEQPCLPMFCALAVRFALLLLQRGERPDLLKPLCVYITSSLQLFPSLATAMSMHKHTALCALLAATTTTAGDVRPDSVAGGSTGGIAARHLHTHHPAPPPPHYPPPPPALPTPPSIPPSNGALRGYGGMLAHHSPLIPHPPPPPVMLAPRPPSAITNRPSPLTRLMPYPPGPDNYVPSPLAGMNTPMDMLFQAIPHNAMHIGLTPFLPMGSMSSPGMVFSPPAPNPTTGLPPPPPLTYGSTGDFNTLQPGVNYPGGSGGLSDSDGLDDDICGIDGGYDGASDYLDSTDDDIQLCVDEGAPLPATTHEQ